MYVKRCIGLPGDSLQIKEGRVVVNGKPVPEVPVRFRYLVETDGAVISQRIMEKNGIGEDDYIRTSAGTYEFFLTQEQAAEFKALRFLRKVELAIDSDGRPGPMVYPVSGNFRWSADFYGPLYLPRRGDKIELTDRNTDLYLKCIEFENESVERDDSGLIVNGQSIRSYEFKENYFFMMGDNRHNSFDSRYWGLLPGKLVIGKALYLYWGATRDRIGKEVN